MTHFMQKSMLGFVCINLGKMGDETDGRKECIFCMTTMSNISIHMQANLRIICTSVNHARYDIAHTKRIIIQRKSGFVEWKDESN
jgi:hypothetical protein